MAIRRTGNGFTLVELLVCIAVVGVLVALLLPAVQQARATVRKAQCASHQRQLHLGITSHVETHKKLVASGYWEPAASKGLRSWVVEVLPFIEQNSIYDRWDRAALWNSGVNLTLASAPIAIITCPSDETTVRSAGNLSYVLNGGVGWWQKAGDSLATLRNDSPNQSVKVLLDINGDGSVSPATGEEKEIFQSFGIFTNQIESPTSRGSGLTKAQLQTIVDGLSQTVMLSENIRTGYDQSRGFNWATPFATQTTFMISGRILSTSAGALTINYDLANQRNSGLAKYEGINAPLDFPEGRNVRPSSRHVGGVNVTFCDGHMQFLNENIDGKAYVALVSPRDLQR